MSKLETVLPYKISNYEEAAYLLSKYFIERNFEADVIKSKDKTDSYSSVISKQGLAKNFFGSRTVFIVTFSLESENNQGAENSTNIEIESKLMTDGIIKEFTTYLFILPALRKLSDYAKILNICKKKSVDICEKLKINANNSIKETKN